MTKIICVRRSLTVCCGHLAQCRLQLDHVRHPSPHLHAAAPCMLYEAGRFAESRQWGIGCWNTRCSTSARVTAAPHHIRSHRSQGRQISSTMKRSQQVAQQSTRFRVRRVTAVPSTSVLCRDEGLGVGNITSPYVVPVSPKVRIRSNRSPRSILLVLYIILQQHFQARKKQSKRPVWPPANT